MAFRSVSVWQLIRVLGVACLGILLTSCSVVTRSNAEEEPAPLCGSQWSARLSNAERPIVARATADAVVVVTDGAVTVLDRRDGKRRWSQATETPSYQDGHQVFVVNDSVVVVGGKSAVVYDLTDGEQRFRWQHDSRHGTQGVGVLRTGLLVDSCGTHYQDCTVSLLDLHTGKPLWQRQVTALHKLLSPAPRDVTPGSGGAEVTDLMDPLLPSEGAEAVVLTDGTVEGAPDEPDRATRLDMRTGAVVGSFAVPRELGRSTSDGGGTRLLGDVILHSENACGQYTAYDARTGAQRWSRPVNQRHLELPTSSYINDMSVKCESTQPPVSDGGLLVSAPTHEPQIMDLTTGEPRWTAKPEGVWLGYDNGIAMAWTDPDGPYRALDTKTNNELWTHRPPWLQEHDPVDAKLALAAYAVGFGQFFYSGIEDNGSSRDRSVVRTLDLKTGRPLWAAKGDNRLLGVGDDWVVTTSVPGYDDPTEVRLFER